ncbi:MAG: glycosyltransferase family 9 protein [Bacteriovoracales bacterium]|nr:glycosyltransferase family 9 protein [Bacteriovoracales bacterium]
MKLLTIFKDLLPLFFDTAPSPEAQCEYMAPPLHLLLIRFSSIGDIPLHLCVAANIKERWGNRVHLSLLTSSLCAPLMEGAPFIDDIHGFPKKAPPKALLRFIRSIHQKKKIDFLLDLHGSLRSLLVRLYFWKIPGLCLDKRSFERHLLIFAKLDLLSFQYRSPSKGSSSKGSSKERKRGEGEPVVERIPKDFAPVFRYRPEEREGKWPKTFCAKTFEKSSFLRPSSLRSPYILVAVSASQAQKRWPLSSYERFLAQALVDEDFQGLQFVITAGPVDDFCSRFFELEKRHPKRLLNLQGKTSLTESVHLAKEAHFCLGNDTGILHLAESVGTPVLAIFGPTGQAQGLYPHLPESDTLSLSLWCRPCNTSTKGRCIRSERFCLTRISPEMVRDKLKTLLRALPQNRIVLP